MHTLSIPTWIIHISSVIEWIAGIWFVLRYAEITGDRSWLWLAYGMLPSLISAMCACTWHLLDNAPTWEWLVSIQALTTVIGNSTLCLAGWKIFRSSKIQSEE